LTTQDDPPNSNGLVCSSKTNLVRKPTGRCDTCFV